MIYSWEIEEKAEKHAKFLTNLLATTNGVTLATCEFLAKEVFIHAWRHCEEELQPNRVSDVRFIRKR